MKVLMDVAQGNRMKDKLSKHDISHPMKTMIPAPKPDGMLLVFIAGCIAVGMPFATIHADLRAFDVDPRQPAYQAMMSLPLFVSMVLPIILLILLLIRRRLMRPLFRTFLVLLPALLFTLPGLVEALATPEKPGVAFVDRMGTLIPEDATGFKAWYSHGGGDSSYMFNFRCSAGSIEALLSAGTYELLEDDPMLDPEMRHLYPLPIGGMTPPKGWPQPQSWKGVKIYSSVVPDGYRYLLTDADRSQVFILVGDT